MINFCKKIFSCLIVSCLLFTSACSSFSGKFFGKNSAAQNEISSATEVKKTDEKQEKNVDSPVKKEPKLDGKKLAKEAGTLIVGDIILATVCKNGLHLSFAVCLITDIAADVGIITYYNLPKHKEKKSVALEAKEISAKNGVDNAKINSHDEEEEDVEFNPLEFVLGIGLMAITLVVI